MVVSLIPKEEYEKKRHGLKISSAWMRQNLLPLVSVLMFFGAVCAYVVLLLYGGDLKEHAVELQENRDGIISRIDTEQRLLASNFAIRAEELYRIIGEHHKPSFLLEFLEDTTHPDVTISSFAFSFMSGEIRLSGTTGGYGKLAEQILIWNEDPLIVGVDVSDFSFGTEGNLRFNATLHITQDAYDQS